MSMEFEQFYDTLQPGDQILWYEILRVLGKGGFGVTYLGRDTNLDQLVAIKEYMPAGFSTREGGVLRAISPDSEETFLWGLERFLKEAQILARFKHPNIVRVLSFFRDRNTAYMVMEYEEGESLESVLKKRKILTEALLKPILFPMLSGLELLHSANIIHRDIKPPNIFIRKDGSPVILDFGSARQAIAGQQAQMTSLLSMGYSPIEQYDTSGNRQGPWSDIYAMGGVLYRAVTGEKPMDAAIRMATRFRSDPDPLKPAVEAKIGQYAPGFLQAIDKALMLLETERPQSIAAWRPMLMGLDFVAEPLSSQERPAPPSPLSVQKIEPEEDDLSASNSQRASMTRNRSSWRSFITSLNDFTQVGEKSRKVREELPVEARKGPLVVATPVEEESEHPPQLGNAWIEPLTKIEFVWIPGGRFIMGSEKGETGRKQDEGPAHEVLLDGFWIGRYPVTYAQWKRVLGDSKGAFPPTKNDFPMDRVLWEDAQTFLRSFSRMTGGKYKVRLPSEAEWEYAARTGNRTAFHFGDDPSFLGDFAWFIHNSGGMPQPVGLKRPNDWGLYDMLGNVWEWTEDWYAEDFYSKSPPKNPRGAPFGEIRVRRGGSWRSHPLACRVAHRNRVSVTSNSNSLGIRLVCIDEKWV